MGKVRTTYKGGIRFYIHPADSSVTHPGVTSVIGMLPKQNFLAPWNARMTAELAVDSIDFVKEMAERDRAGAIDYLRGAARRYTKARSDVGSEAHDLFERLMRGEYVGRQRSDIQPYVDNFRDFMARVNPELVRAEDVAWSDTYGYAGSFDVWMRIWAYKRLDGKIVIDPTRGPDSEPLLVLGDWKTSRSTYPDVALQLAAYANADFVLDAEGNKLPMPEFDAAMVLHITDETWALKPVDIGPDVFAQFLHLRSTFDWDREQSKRVIGKPVAAKAGAKIVTGTQRRG